MLWQMKHRRLIIDPCCSESLALVKLLPSYVAIDRCDHFREMYDYAYVISTAS